MDAFLEFATNDHILQILLYLFAAAAIWFFLRIVFGFVRRLFALGCAAILVFGMIVILLRYFI